jgi:hypothetical protein
MRHQHVDFLGVLMEQRHQSPGNHTIAAITVHDEVQLIDALGGEVIVEATHGIECHRGLKCRSGARDVGQHEVASTYLAQPGEEFPPVIAKCRWGCRLRGVLRVCVHRFAFLGARQGGNASSDNGPMKETRWTRDPAASPLSRQWNATPRCQILRTLSLLRRASRRYLAVRRGRPHLRCRPLFGHSNRTATAGVSI